jgi:hypothetical protein
MVLHVQAKRGLIPVSSLFDNPFIYLGLRAGWGWACCSETIDSDHLSTATNSDYYYYYWYYYYHSLRLLLVPQP